MLKKKDPIAIFDKFVNELSKPKPIKEGQNWLHELPKFRDWEVALNVIHVALKSKPSYVGIVTNTRRRLNGIIEGINFENKKEDISDELQALLRIKIKTFHALTQKIRNKQAMLDQDRDVWCFTTPWNQFSEGTKIIAVHQEIAKKFSMKAKKYRRAFVILDQKCSIASQNQILFIIQKVFEDERNIKKILKLAAIEFVKRPTPKKNRQKYKGRMPGRLVILLRNQFEIIIPSITNEEKMMLLSYFNMLRDMEELSKDHKNIEKRLRRYFKEDDANDVVKKADLFD